MSPVSDLLTVFGGPGCGKTTRLLSIVEEELSRGVHPRDVCYTTFTVKAANEAKERAVKRFGIDPDEDLKLFSTIHSICFRALGARKNQVLTDRQYLAILKELIGEQVTVSGSYDEDACVWRGPELGDRLITAEQLSRLTMLPIERFTAEYAFAPWLGEKWIAALTRYKHRSGRLDFIDMLVKALDEDRLPRVKVMIIDEAQDLSPLQWKVVLRMAESADRVYVAGDDDQAIYNWAGADVRGFLNVAGRGKIETLPVSHRLPPKVFSACSNILKRITVRQPKEWRPTEKDGSIRLGDNIEWTLVKEDLRADNGSWYFLGRTMFQTGMIEAAMIRAALPFSLNGESMLDRPSVRAARAWTSLQRGKLISRDDTKSLLHFINATHVNKERADGLVGDKFSASDLTQLLELRDLDKPWFEVLSIPIRMTNYIRALSRKKISLDTIPWINVSTIHRAKGGEADHVWLDSALTRKIKFRIERRGEDADSEHRVFYVGASRAKRRLLFAPPGSAVAFGEYPRFF